MTFTQLILPVSLYQTKKDPIVIITMSEITTENSDAWSQNFKGSDENQYLNRLFNSHAQIIHI
jgi:hypothetical protein